jgi:anti-sigma factor RsiW
VQCDDLSGLLAASPDGVTLEDRRASRHVEGCLRCQAEIAQYRKLLRALRTLRTEVLTPAPGMVSDVLASLEAAGERHAVRSLLHGRRVAYVGGLAVATAAAGAGAAIVLASRSKGRRFRLAG